MAESGRILTGPRASISINGRRRGYARDLRIEESLRYDPLRVLGNIRVQEQVPISYEVQLRASEIFVVGDSIKSDLIFPKVGSSPEEHQRNILDLAELDISIEDVRTRQIMANFPDARCTSHSLSVGPEGLSSVDVEFVATVMFGQFEIGSAS